MAQPYFTICLPSYNAGAFIGETLDSLMRQTFTDWQCLVVDDGSTDDTEAAVLSVGDPRIRFVRNDHNVGYPGNLQRCFDLAQSGEVLYLLGNDDILSPIALERTFSAFQLAPDIAVVTRPYFFFETTPDVAIRYTPLFDPDEDRIMSPHDGAETWLKIYSSLAQLSALAFRRKLVVGRCNPWVFPAHVEPWLETFKRHRGVFLKDYPLAVRKGTSQTRHVPGIYDPSALWSWVDMFDRVFSGDEWALPRRLGRNFIARNTEGLVQIRCHSTMKIFLREVVLYAHYRPANLLALRYWFYVFGSLAMPPRSLRRITDILTPFFCRPRDPRVRLAHQLT